jgi:hypothetical protein
VAGSAIPTSGGIPNAKSVYLNLAKINAVSFAKGQILLPIALATRVSIV